MARPGAQGAGPSADVLERIHAELAEPSTLKKVYSFAWGQVKWLGRIGRLASPVGPSAVEELVNQAIADTMDGTLTWNPQAVRLSTHLCQAIKSRTWKQGTRDPAVELSPLPDEARGKARSTPESLTATEAPDAPFLEHEQDQLDRLLASAVREHLDNLVRERNAEHVGLLLLAYDEGIEGRSDIAQATGMTVDEVTNARKRLKGMLTELPSDLAARIRDRLRAER